MRITNRHLFRLQIAQEMTSKDFILLKPISKMHLKEFNEETLDGRKVLSTIVFEDGKLVHTQKAIKVKFLRKMDIFKNLFFFFKFILLQTLIFFYFKKFQISRRATPPQS